MPSNEKKSNRLQAALGPLYPFCIVSASLLALLSGSRLGIALLFHERLDNLAQLFPVMLNGLRIDLVVIAYLLCLPVFLFPILHTLSRRAAISVEGMLILWGVGVFLVLLFLELVTPFYLLEYGVRPERKFFEYLNNPREVLLMLWGTYGFYSIGIMAVVAGSAVPVYRLFAKSFNACSSWSVPRLALLLPLIALLLLIGMRSSLDHRPINPSMVAFTDDTLVNSLPLNSLYSVAYAAYSLKDEANASEIYGNLPRDDIFDRVAQVSRQHNAAGLSAGASVTAGESAHKNLVIILEESLGARFVGALGGEPLTPNLDRLASQGWWFEHLYATGTRSVRGLEATVTGFLPTPGRSTVKLSGSQSNFFTLASHLRHQGYHSSFYYGGRAHFDNMKGFFLGNGFHRVVEQDDFVDARFVGTWGASDEDVLARIHADLLQDPEQPKLVVVLTTSNHTPFDFPVEPGDRFEQPLKSRNNAIRYADKALGQFFDRAQGSPYWDNSVFLVVADHDLRAADLSGRSGTGESATGMQPFPVAGFHIPGLILGGGIRPERVNHLSSQIDLPPTLLSLVGAAPAAPLIGTDLTRVEENYVGRAIMQFNDSQAYLDGNSLVVLRPGRPPLKGRYENGRFTPADDPKLNDLAKTALAHALWASIMYRESRYN